MLRNVVSRSQFFFARHCYIFDVVDPKIKKRSGYIEYLLDRIYSVIFENFLPYCMENVKINLKLTSTCVVRVVHTYTLIQVKMNKQ